MKKIIKKVKYQVQNLIREKKREFMILILVKKFKKN